MSFPKALDVDRARKGEGRSQKHAQEGIAAAKPAVLKHRSV